MSFVFPRPSGPSGNIGGLQETKLTFLGRRQLATESFFFSCQIEKCGRQKVFENFFLCSETQVNGKFWSPIFLSRIKMKRMHLGPQWRLFRQRIKLNTSTLIIYTPSTEKQQQRNQMPVVYAVSCDCQMFQVNFINLLLHPTEKLLFVFLLYVQNDLCQDNRRIAMLLAPGHNHAAFLVPVP